MVKKIFGDPRNFGGSDPTNELIIQPLQLTSDAFKIVPNTVVNITEFGTIFNASDVIYYKTNSLSRKVILTEVPCINHYIL